MVQARKVRREIGIVEIDRLADEVVEIARDRGRTDRCRDWLVAVERTRGADQDAVRAAGSSQSGDRRAEHALEIDGVDERDRPRTGNRAAVR